MRGINLETFNHVRRSFETFIDKNGGLEGMTNKIAEPACSTKNQIYLDAAAVVYLSKAVVIGLLWYIHENGRKDNIY
jgi:hypothetical protein